MKALGALKHMERKWKLTINNCISPRKLKLFILCCGLTVIVIIVIFIVIMIITLIYTNII